MSLLRQVFAVVGLSLLTLAALAQEAPDLTGFERIANAVQTDLEEDRVSDAALERLRAELAEWRTRLTQNEDVNAAEIEAIRAQIEALGPPPAEGEAEAEDIAARREALAAALAEARAPVIEAEEAWARADALIRRIDERLRERQTRTFLTLQRSPLSPALWAQTAADLRALAQDVAGEVALRQGRPGRTLEERLPLIAFFLAAAAVLILRGARWIERATRWVETRSGEQGRVIWGFLVSLGAIALPLLGISLINAAIVTTGLLGSTGETLALGLNAGIVVYFVARWLGQRVFPERPGIPSILILDEEARGEGRLLARLIGAALGLIVMALTLQTREGVDPETLSVILYPPHLALGILLWRLGRLIALTGTEEEDATGYATALQRMAGRATQGAALAGPVLATIGYFNMAIGILVPTSVTLALGGFIAALHVALRAGFARARGLGHEEAEAALTPVLVTFVLTILALPVLALIWGMRPTELAELWTRIQAGFRLGEATIRPTDFLTIAVVFVLGLLMTRLLQATLRGSVLPRTRLDKGGQNALVAGLGYVGITLAAIAAITAAGIDLSNLALVVGALGVGIGFGLQNIVNNFVSGIILLIERPIGEGDWVEVNGATGFVRAISVRSTRIETFDRTDVIVPNGDLISGTVTNWTHGNSVGRVIVPVGVAYGSDTRRVEDILREIAMAHPIVAVNPEPAVLFMGFGADSLDFEIRAILTDVNFLLSVRSDLNHEIARRFAEEGIEIPFAQRDLWLRNPEALSAVVAGAQTPESDT